MKISQTHSDSFSLKKLYKILDPKFFILAGSIPSSSNSSFHNGSISQLLNLAFEVTNTVITIFHDFNSYFKNQTFFQFKITNILSHSAFLSKVIFFHKSSISNIFSFSVSGLFKLTF
jgi:hypothetical protein